MSVPGASGDVAPRGGGPGAPAGQADLVSIVIPCYNPESYLLEAIASARSQDYANVEVVLVNDGTTSPAALELLKTASQQAEVCLEQENRGLAAARNAGFQAARGRYVVTLDCDDVLEASFVSECVSIIRDRPEIGFVYTDYLVFGEENYMEQLPEYNLYRLLEQNIVCVAALIRKADWELAGGYNEAMRLGYEDWDFWLRMAAKERFGYHLRRLLFRYRKHGRTLFDIARAHHQKLVAEIQAGHPELYEYEGRAKIKARWRPVVAVVGNRPESEQTIEDWQLVDACPPEALLGRTAAPAFLFPSESPMESHSAEFAALAIWGGNDRLRLPDGSTAVSRRTIAAGRVDERPGVRGARPLRIPARQVWPDALQRLRRHLCNAGLLSLETWRNDPVGALTRLIPLRLKERVNRAFGKTVFDLTFYLKFQPAAVLVSNKVIEPLRYMPRPASKRRIALMTPHLGPGGAEQVLLEIARSLDRSQCEIFVLATHSQDSRWLPRWKDAADHVYDLASLVPDDRLVAALYSLALNWQFDVVLIQNTLLAYSSVPAMKKALPDVRVMDLVHSVDERWDIISSTAAVSREMATRIVISEAARSRLRQAGVEQDKIRLIPNGIDLELFKPAGPRASDGTFRILFAGRLDAVKRPLLLVDIVLALLRRRRGDFHLVVAGDGPEEQRLRRRLRQAGIDQLFDLRGYVPHLAPVLAEVDVVVIPSRNEGIPLVLLEALASGKPVVASNVGAISEVLDSTCGFLVDGGAGEVEQFADRINALLDDLDLRESMGVNGRRKVEASYSCGQSRRMYRELFA